MKALARRSFLRRLGTAAAPILLTDEATAQSQPVRFGIIGVGMQGAGLLSTASRLPNVECVAAADLYDGRHTLSREITGNANLDVTREYRRLLDRKDIDCIIAAVPDHWHKRIVTEACAAGKDVYCEKPMSHTVADGFAMVDATQAGKRIVQVGSQRVSSLLCAKARELFTAGAIGELQLVELSMGRNDPTGAWQYPPPLDLSPANLDWDTWLNGAPKIPFDKFRFARWRCYKEYGTGVGGDLMVHLISGMLYTLGWNEAPRTASAVGGILRWKDGRNMPDTHMVVFDYHGVPVYVRLNLGSETAERARFLGSKGVLEATGGELRLTPQTGEDHAPSYYAGSFPRAMREQYEREWRAANPAKTGSAVMEEIAYRGADWDDLRRHLRTFFDAVVTRQPVAEDAVFGNHAAIACHMANESYFTRRTIAFDPAARQTRAL